MVYGWRVWCGSALTSNRNKGLSASVPIEGLSLVERDEKTGQVQEARKRSPMEASSCRSPVALVLAMIVMVGSAPMLQNVTQTRASGLSRRCLASVTPFELLTGKVLGSVAVSLTSSVLYVVGGTMVVSALGIAGLLPLSIFPWFYAYLLADMVILSALRRRWGHAAAPRRTRRIWRSCCCSRACCPSS